MAQEKRYWLIKSEPETYGIDALKKDGETSWGGVRNFQARNFIRDDMRKGDGILFYHSSCKVPGVYGIAKVTKDSYPDPTQFDKKSDYFDPRATHEKPTWFSPDIAFVRVLKNPITIEAIRANKKLAGMKMLQPGSRLSVTPVSKAEFEEIERMSSK
jgi:predicted RNA-binding protein with PUA-like domain